MAGITPIVGIQFNGTDAYFSNLTAQTDLDPGFQSFVIEADAKSPTPVQLTGFIVSAGYDAGDGGIDIWWDGQNLKFGISEPTDTFGLTLSVNQNVLINDGLTHRMAFVYDVGDSTLEMFVDGVSVGSADASIMDGQTIAIPGIRFGRSTFGGSSYLTGSIFGINWMVGTTTISAVPSPLTKLTANGFTTGLWPLTEASGAVVDTVNAISLTPSGTPVYQVSS